MMSDAVINKLSTIDLATIVVLIILVNTIASFLNPWVEKIKGRIIKQHTKEEADQALSKMVKQNHDRIGTYEENRIHDRQQSFEIQKQLTDAINNLNKKFDEYIQRTEERFTESRQREDKRTRAELKDRISQHYRYHHATGKWTSMEKEALTDLIAEYEAAGGDNSFVHTTVAAEMYTWEIIDAE